MKKAGFSDDVAQCTPQPLYKTIVRVQTNFRVSYPIRVVTKVKCSYISKSVFNDYNVNGVKQ